MGFIGVPVDSSRVMATNSEGAAGEDGRSGDGALSGKLARAREGKNPGFKPPYGYLTDPESGVFVVEAGEAAVVRRIFTLYRQGSGAISIAQRLNQEGAVFRHGRRWSQSTVRKILENPIYFGQLQYGRISRNPNRGRRDGEPFYLHHEPRVVLRDAVPAIVTREEWAEAQLARVARPCAARGTSGRAFSSRYLLSGLAKCRCGQSIIGHKGPGGCLYYCCSGQRKKGKRACSCGYLRLEEVDRIVLTAFQEQFLRGTELRRKEIDAAREIATKRAGEARRALALVRENQGRDLQPRVGAAELERHLREAEMEAARWGYEAEMLQQAARFDLLAVEQRKQILRHFVRSILLFREDGSQQLRCEIQWRQQPASL